MKNTHVNSSRGKTIYIVCSNAIIRASVAASDARRLCARLRALRSVALAFASLWLSLVPLHDAAADEIRLAIFDFELLDTSLQGEVSGVNPAEQQRLAMISDLLRQRIAESKRYDVIDIAPAREKIAAAGYLRGCNGCDATIARELGAEQSMTGVVQKVSNLILNLNLYMRDANSGELLKVVSADIRGNTDQSWAHGVNWLVRNRVLK